MKMLFKSVFAVTALAIISLSFTARAETVAPRAVDQVDIRQYAGKWYEIAHLPMYFQRKCVSDISAQYTVNADQTLGVLNSCRIENREMISSEGGLSAKSGQQQTEGQLFAARFKMDSVYQRALLGITRGSGI